MDDVVFIVRLDNVSVVNYTKMNRISGIVFFFFKQKTAYEMRISDWSSDVCSSDLGQFLESHLSKTIDTVGDSPRPRKSPGILAHRARNTVSRPHPRGKAHRA